MKLWSFANKISRRQCRDSSRKRSSQPRPAFRTLYVDRRGPLQSELRK
jgi:hypothetical protein